MLAGERGEARVNIAHHREALEIAVTVERQDRDVARIRIPHARDRLFAPLGWWAAFSAFCNSLLADVITNVHTFFVVGPNHTGDNVYRFDDAPASRGEFCVRQVIGSVNYRTGGDACDYAQLWLNYQIEHHLFPAMPTPNLRAAQPIVRDYCAEIGVPYEMTGLLESYRQALRHLHEVGAELRAR